jgi:hypothetical protein
MGLCTCSLSSGAGQVFSVKAASGLLKVIKVTFPELPYVELRANFHRTNFWFTRMEITKIAREEAFLLGKQQVHLTKPIDRCEIEEVFTVPARRRMDVENLMGACKPWVDGLVDSGIIVDDGWEHVRKLSGQVIYKKGVEQTEIIIIPLTH